MVWYQFILLVGLLLVLVKSSDFFVEAVARIAEYLGVSKFLLGLTVIALGTSLPELGSSVMASFAGETELAVGNILGSNIANIGLILGLSAVIIQIKTNRQIFMRDGLIMFGITMVFVIFSIDGAISQLEGLVLITLTPMYLAYLFRFRPQFRKHVYKLTKYLALSHRFNRIIHFGVPEVSEKVVEKELRKEPIDDFVGKGFDLEEYRRVRNRISIFRNKIMRDLVITLSSAIMIYMSARYMIPVAVYLAKSLGVTENVIGATLIAAGTSLPELSVSISSLRKGFGTMVLGNIIGSNIFNITLVGGLSAIIAPLNILPTTLTLSIPFLIIVTGLLFIFVRTDWTVRKYEGAGLFAIYLLFIYLLFSSRF